MTREEAISIIERVEQTESKWPGTEDTLEALDMAIAALRSQQQTEANEPLNLDELRQMDGEPVWVEFGECGDWRIPDFIDIGAYRGFIRFTDRSSELLADYGKDWLAYRHKPEPHTGTCTATNQPCSMCQPGPCGSRKEAHHGSN